LRKDSWTGIEIDQKTGDQLLQHVVFRIINLPAIPCEIYYGPAKPLDFGSFDQ
jgi:dolichyl-phosphate-mannose--protein O-mannosyl transferase